MADVLTQLQDCLDQLATQITASFHYTLLNAPPSHLPGAPRHTPASPPPTQNTIDPPTQNSTNPSFPTNANSNSFTTTYPSQDPSSNPLNQNPTQTSFPPEPQQNSTNLRTQDPSSTDPPIPPLPSPAEFAASQHELASDLLTKVNQINTLVDTLPGLDSTRAEQEARIRELETELKAVEGERRGWVKRRERAVEGLEGVISGVRRFG